MKIDVNNKEISVDSSITVEKLLKQLGHHGWVTVFVNGNKLLEKEYENAVLKERDIIKIIKPLSGG